MGRFIYVSLGLLVLAFSLRGSGADCPSGWSAYDRNCYKVFDERKNWDEAERFCTEQGKEGHLVSLGSIEEGNFVAKLTVQELKKPQPTNVWIGLTAQGEKQQQRKICTKHSRNWPYCRSLSKSCLVLSKQTEYLKWNNHNCGFTLPFVCKFLAEPDDLE